MEVEARSLQPPLGSAPDWGGARERCVREALRVLRDGHAAEEAAQEALLRAWRYRSSRRNGSWTPWLRRIARREALRLAARRQRVRSAEVGQPVEPASEREARELSGVLDGVAFEQRLASLGDGERTLIRLRYEEELSNPEIARRLAIPEGTVKVRLHRLRHRLREAIKDEEEGSSR